MPLVAGSLDAGQTSGHGGRKRSSWDCEKDGDMRQLSWSMEQLAHRALFREIRLGGGERRGGRGLVMAGVGDCADSSTRPGAERTARERRSRESGDGEGLNRCGLAWHRRRGHGPGNRQLVD